MVSSRGASVRLWGRVDTRGKIGRRYGNLGFPFQEGRLRRFGLSRGNPVPALRDGVSYWSTGLSNESEPLACFIFRFAPPMEKLGLNKTRLTDQGLEFGSVGQSYSRIVFGAAFPSGETPSHAIGAVE